MPGYITSNSKNMKTFEKDHSKIAYSQYLPKKYGKSAQEPIPDNAIKEYKEKQIVKQNVESSQYYVWAINITAQLIQMQ